MTEIDLHGSVEVPRAALYGFRDFLNRFAGGGIGTAELQDKLRWIDLLLQQPKK